MNWQETFTEIGQQLIHTSACEWVAVVFGVLQVLLAWRNLVWLYPAGIISTVFSVYLLADVKLYAEAFLNLYYLVMSIYGWWLWHRKREEKELAVTRTTKTEWTYVALIVFVGWALLFFILRKFTPSDVPLWDAWVSATAWAGMWLLAKRKLENWLVLNLSNAFAIPLQFHKNIPMYGLLTIVLFVVAIFGYLRWKKLLQSLAS
jgi:nicotinamide mononucleotide transporter